MATEKDLQIYKDTTTARISGQVKVLAELTKRMEKYVSNGSLASADNLAPSLIPASESLIKTLNKFKVEVERMKEEIFASGE